MKDKRMSELFLAKSFVVMSALFLVWTLSSCSSVTTTTEYPDGRKVTETRKQIDPAAVPLATEAAGVAHDIIRDK